MGSPALLPTPPFTVVHGLMLDPKTYPGFVGYQQKQLLLHPSKRRSSTMLQRHNPIIKNTCPGKPGYVSHVKHKTQKRKDDALFWLPFVVSGYLENDMEFNSMLNYYRPP